MVENFQGQVHSAFFNALDISKTKFSLAQKLHLTEEKENSIQLKLSK